MQHKISYENWTSVIYGRYHFGTLVLALHCYCEDNVKHGLLSKSISIKVTTWRLKNFGNNNQQVITWNKKLS